MANPVVKWPAGEIADFGPVEEFELDVPADANGRLDVYAVPKSTNYPDGYWFNLGYNLQSHEFVEPGCCSWEKKLLAKIRFTKESAEDDDSSMSKGPQNPIVEYIHPSLKLDMDALNFVEAK